jgi:hypothetical protein
VLRPHAGAESVAAIPAGPVRPTPGYRASRPHIAELGRVRPAARSREHEHDRDRHAEAVATDGVAVVRVEGGLFFTTETQRGTARAGRDEFRVQGRLSEGGR